MGPEFLHEHHILRQGFRGLTGRTYHNAAAGLVADFLQILKTTHAFFQGLIRWMKMGIVDGIRSFMPQQIPVSPGIEQPPVRFPASFSQGEGHGAVGIRLLDGPDDFTHPFIMKPAVLTALEHKGTETGLITFPAAGENILRGQTVTGNSMVGAADATVITVVFADVGKFHNTAEIDGFSEMEIRNLSGTFGGIGCILGSKGGKQGDPFFPVQFMVLVQQVDTFPVGHDQASF